MKKRIGIALLAILLVGLVGMARKDYFDAIVIEGAATFEGTIGFTGTTISFSPTTSFAAYSPAIYLGYDAGARMSLAFTDATGVLAITHAGSGPAITWAATSLAFTGNFSSDGATAVLDGSTSVRGLSAGFTSLESPANRLGVDSSVYMQIATTATTGATAITHTGTGPAVTWTANSLAFTGNLSSDGTTALFDGSTSFRGISAGFTSLESPANRFGVNPTIYMQIATTDTTGITAITHTGSAPTVTWTANSFDFVGAFAADALTLSDVLTFSDSGTIDNTAADTLTITETNITLAGLVGITSGTITGITDLAVADGGTGSSNASDARTALGLAIGSNVQAWDAQLDDIAALIQTDSYFIVGDGSNWIAETGATARASLGLTIGTHVQAYDAELAALAGLTFADDQFILGTGAGTVGMTSCTVFAQSILDDADEATFKATVNLESGTDVQAYDADLAALAGLTSAADKGIQFTGSGTAGTYDLTAFAKTILDDADEATFKATVNLEPGTDVQAYDAELAALAGLTFADDQFVLGTGAGTVGMSSCTVFAQSILDDADEATFKATVNLEPGTDIQTYDAELAALAGLTFADDQFVLGTGAGTVGMASCTVFAQSLLDDADEATFKATVNLEADVDFNAYDADLTTYAGITPTSHAQTALGNANNSMVMCHRHRVTAAEINTGHELLPAIVGKSYRLVSCKAIAYGGGAADVTTVDLLGTQSSSGVKLVAYAQANLTQSTVLYDGMTGATVLADGASYQACDAGAAITVGKTGSDVTGATGVDFILQYVIE
jgi:hypothetical protein